MPSYSFNFRYAKGVISDLLQNKVDISLLVISKSFAKKEEDYAAKQAHVEVLNVYWLIPTLSRLFA